MSTCTICGWLEHWTYVCAIGKKGWLVGGGGSEMANKIVLPPIYGDVQSAAIISQYWIFAKLFRTERATNSKHAAEIIGCFLGFRYCVQFNNKVYSRVSKYASSFPETPLRPLLQRLRVSEVPNENHSSALISVKGLNHFIKLDKKSLLQDRLYHNVVYFWIFMAT